MGWWKKLKDKVKKVFKKVTKVVKKVVKKIGGAAKKVWNGVKKVAKKAGAFLTKLGPVANIAMNFIPGFGQLWQAYGIWGSMAKGAITGYLTSGGNVKGALLGAAGAAAGDWYSKLPGNGVSEKLSNVFDLDGSSGKLAKSFTKFDPYVGNAGRSSDAYGFAEVELNKNLKGTNYWNNRAMTMNGGEYADGLTLKPDDYSQYMSQVDVDAQNYDPAVDDPTKKKNDLLPKLADGLSEFLSRDKGDTVETQGFVGDTSPLKSIDTSTLLARGKTGMGRDSDEDLIRRLGLTTLYDQSLLAQQKMA